MGQLFDARDVLGEREYERDPGVRAFFLPQRFVNILAAPAFREDSALFLACRTAADGELDGMGRAALAKFMPHLEAAMRVHNRLYLASSEITNLRGALDVVEVGVIFLDRQLRIHYAGLNRMGVLCPLKTPELRIATTSFRLLGRSGCRT